MYGYKFHAHGKVTTDPNIAPIQAVFYSEELKQELNEGRHSFERWTLFEPTYGADICEEVELEMDSSGNVEAIVIKTNAELHEDEEDVLFECMEENMKEVQKNFFGNFAKGRDPLGVAIYDEVECLGELEDDFTKAVEDISENEKGEQTL